jgi:small GTP-binding protein
MVFFNYATMQMAAKIVYYGPGLCGKTTNLQHIYQKTSSKSRGEMVSLETETDRTLFFDLLPLDVGTIAGFKTRFQLYTVPGQVFYNSTRKLVLRGVDGIVFVADSQTPMLDANVESLTNLKDNLTELGLNIDEVPLVLQYNKRDLKNVIPVLDMNSALNQKNLPFFEASALQGAGVFETLKGISRATLIMLRKKALGDEKAPATSPKTQPPPSRPIAPEPARTQVPVGAAVATAPTAAEIAREKVEFSEVQTPQTQPPVKRIAVKKSDIASELDSLRDLYTGKSSNKDRKASDSVADSVSSLLETAKVNERRVTKKLKIKLEPEEIEAINNLSIDFHLTGDSLSKRFSNALSVSVSGKGNPKRVSLEIELEILKK